MDLLPPHPPPPSSGVAATAPRPRTIPPANLPPVPSVAPSAAPSVAAERPSATPSATAAPSASASAGPPATPDDRSTAFHAVDASGDPGTNPGLGTTLLVEAYSAIWIIMMGFVLLGWRKQGALGLRIDDLEKAIDKSAAAKEKKE